MHFKSGNVAVFDILLDMLNKLIWLILFGSFVYNFVFSKITKEFFVFPENTNEFFVFPENTNEFFVFPGNTNEFLVFPENTRAVFVFPENTLYRGFPKPSKNSFSRIAKTL